MSMGPVSTGAAKSMLVIVPSERGTVYAPVRYTRRLTYEQNAKSGSARPR